MHSWLQKEWQSISLWQVFLLPLSWLFHALIHVRYALYHLGILKTSVMPVPVVVVGNINVGGTGKTPLVIWLVEQLIARGFQPGVISRGYTGQKTLHAVDAIEVSADNLAGEVGDEPLLLARRLHCPVFVCANRVTAAKALLKTYPHCNVIISDDGLQHYALARQFEIVVVDAQKAFGNRLLLPAGPLRESVSRLENADAVIVNGAQNEKLAQFRQENLTCFDRHMAIANAMPSVHGMQLVASQFYALNNPLEQSDTSAFLNKKIIALAGIGNPARFFTQLKQMGLHFSEVAFKDHHPFSQQDLTALEADIILMTEKDAVKCRAFADARCWVLPVNAILSADFLPRVIRAISST